MSFSLNHPYSGHASYIYANEQADIEDERSSTISRGYEYARKDSITRPAAAPSSYRPPPTKYRCAITDRLFASASVPQFPDFQSDRYKKFSASSYIRTSNKESRRAPAESHVYETMRVRFDTPNQHIVAWRRQMKAAKKRFGRLRQGMAKFVTQNWVLAPHPRLSMIS